MASQQPSAMQLRLALSGAAMFMFFGLIPALPPVHFNKALFPGTRHMYTLHIEATSNGIMLAAVALFLPWLDIKGREPKILEWAMNVGAWMNVLPWLYGARTGAVMKMGEGQVSVATHPELKDNETHAGRIMAMLVSCALGDLVGWGIVILGLARKMGLVGGRK